MKAPGILAALILPSVPLAAGLLVWFAVRGRWTLAAWAACSLVLAIVLTRWAWPQVDRPVALPRAWVRR